MNKIKFFFLLYPVYIVLLTFFFGAIGEGDVLCGFLMGFFTYPILWGTYYAVASVTDSRFNDVYEGIETKKEIDEQEFYTRRS